MKIKAIYFSLVLVITSLFSSCFFYGKTKVYDNVVGINKDISDTVNVMIIHGIGIKYPYYVDDLIRNMCAGLGIHNIDVTKKNKIEPRFKNKLQPKVNKGMIYYLQGFSDTDKKTYRFFIIHWSPI
ncbi:MAG: hypothetical protein ABUT20_39985, partial [Bacteroidota bacterium]